MDVQPLLRRIGLPGLPRPDAGGLRELHRAYVGTVPYEALAAQLGEGAPLDAGELTARVAGGRGGYCFEVNTVLFALLTEAGFQVTRHQANVNGSELTNHMALVVDVDGRRFLADAGLGEGPLDPVALVDGAVTPGPLRWRVERLPHGWRLHQVHAWGSITAFDFADEPSELEAFAPHHARLSGTPESSFVQTLVLQRPYDDRIVTLRSRTLSVVGPTVDRREIVPDEAAFVDVLRDEFGIDAAVLGAERTARLWARACEQHERFLARR
jgi:N-hydroxyarylamine O-acetyltransferase